MLRSGWRAHGAFTEFRCVCFQLYVRVFVHVLVCICAFLYVCVCVSCICNMWLRM